MATPVFLGYDRAALDREYGPDPGETLDLFFPAAPVSTAPIHAFVHGGYWHQRDKADVTFVARGILPAGAIVAIINYALMPAVSMAELVRQCRASIAWLHRSAAAFGGDAARITISGNSAGGHLVAMLLATDWAVFDGLPVDVVKAGCAISGIYDLEPIRLCYLDDVLGLTADDARRHSPIHLAPPQAAPLLLAVGGDEGPEYHRQTDAMAQAWRRAGGPVEVLDLAGHNHSSILWELSDPSTRLARAIQAQIGASQNRAGAPRVC